MKFKTGRSPMNRVSIRLTGVTLASLAAILLVAPASIAGGDVGPGPESADAATSHAVPLSEYRNESLSIRESLRRAVPAKAPDFIEPSTAGPGKPPAATGDPFGVPGTRAAGASPRGAKLFARTSAVRDPYWPLGALDYPNRMVGLLLFNSGGSSSCSAAVTSGASGYAVLTTAGHCVYDIETDRWSSRMRFCPGYRRGCRMGWWKVRWMTTTNTWVNGVTETGVRVWDRSVDDFAVVTLRKNHRGSIGRITGYQGINFNIGTGKNRLSLGYPAPDRDSPYYYDGERLAYCMGYDRLYRGELSIPCTMTGGSSGGPWVTDWDEDYIGYVNSVNSTGPNTRMVGPYFDDEERSAWVAGSKR
ncbi:MAG: trypsin-like serine peptidase [Solirubrobacterales bacterium]